MLSPPWHRNIPSVQFHRRYSTKSSLHHLDSCSNCDSLNLCLEVVAVVCYVYGGFVRSTVGTFSHSVFGSGIHDNLYRWHHSSSRRMLPAEERIDQTQQKPDVEQTTRRIPLQIQSCRPSRQISPPSPSHERFAVLSELQKRI